MKSVEDFDPSGFRAAYEELGFTQADVARAIGTTVNTVGRWVRGLGAPSPRLFAALIEEVGIPRSRMLLPLSPEADLAALRVRAGLRQEDVARKLSVQRSDVSEMELGTARMKEGWAVVLHELYDVPLDRLVRACEVTEVHCRARLDAKKVHRITPGPPNDASSS